MGFLSTQFLPPLLHKSVLKSVFKPSLACDNSYYVNTLTQVFIDNKYIPMPDFILELVFFVNGWSHDFCKCDDP